MATAAIPTKIGSLTFKSDNDVSSINEDKHRQEMDPHFLGMLRSIGHVEKNPHFCRKTLDIDALALKHPNNVIVVAPPFCNAPPRKGITLTLTLNI